MESWVTSLSFAVLLATIPYTFVFKVLLQLPPPLALSHRRWPVPLNSGLIALVTVGVTSFVRSAYYDPSNTPAEITAEFLIVALAYVFGLVLLLRQFSGVYEEFIVTTGPTGLALRKTRYRNIVNVDSGNSRAGETRLRIDTSGGDSLSLTLPARYVSIFNSQLRKKHQDG